MKCPLCDAELRIVKVRNVLENDNKPDVETKLFIEQDLACKNEKCQTYDKVVQTVRNEQPIG